MATKIIDLEDQPEFLRELLAQLDENTELLLMHGDKLIARIKPELKVVAGTRVPGLHAGTTWVSNDFDAPLADDFWLGEA